jgi:hypothetical protein
VKYQAQTKIQEKMPKVNVRNQHFFASSGLSMPMHAWA